MLYKSTSNTLFFAALSILIFCNSAAATIIEDLIGDVKLAPLAITLDTPDAATAIDGTLHVVGSHNGQAARQLVDLATGTVGGVEFFDSLLSANGGNGSTAGAIREVVNTANGVLYVGESAANVTGFGPTSWFQPSQPLGGVGPTGQPDDGFFLDASNGGTMVGTVGDAIYSTHGNLPQVFPGVGTIAKDISGDGKYVAGSLIWQENGLGGYSVVNTAGFDFSVSGGTPTWEAVEIDPVVGDAVFAGSYFDVNTFTERTGFWRADGTFLFSAGENSSFKDFEIFDGQLVAAVNGLDDSFLYSITDFSVIALEAILGVKSLIYDDGLFFGSVGFLASGPNGAFVSSRFIGDGGGGTEVPEPASCLLLASGLGFYLKKHRRFKASA